MSSSTAISKIWTLAICVALSSFSLQAEPNPPLSLDDKAGLEWAMNDNPKAMLPWSKQQFEQADPQKNPKLWIRALWLYASLVQEWKDIPKIRSLLEQAIPIAEQEKMYEEFLAFRSFLIGVIAEQENATPKQEDNSQLQADYEKAIAEAKSFGLKRVEAEAMGSYAFFLRDLGETNRSLQMLLDASKLLQEDPKATELNRMSMKNNLALAFSYQNQNEKALALYEEIDAFCERVQLRSFCLTNLYNMGKLYVDQEDTPTIIKSESYFIRSMKLAEEIGDRWSVATSHSGLITFHSKLKNYNKAVEEAEIAIRLFTEIKNNLWLADSYKKGAKALVGGKRYQEALKFIKAAEEKFPAGYRRDFDDLEDLSYQAYRGLGQIEQALIHLEKHNIEFKKIAQEREKSDYSKLMVGMGLQIEEEKNKVLSKDNELKNQRLKETERLRLFMMAMLGLSVLVMASMVIAVMRSREVKLSRIKMQRILDNIEEGILTINGKLQIESEYSRYLQVLLNTKENLTGSDALVHILQKSSLSSEERSMVQETLRACLGEDEIQWFANEQHLPKELVYPNPTGLRIVSVHWQPLYNKQERVQSILIGLSDVTIRRKLEADIALERQNSDRQGQRIRELAQNDAARIDGLMGQAKALENSIVLAVKSTEERKTVLRELHTIKGIARTLGLKELSSEAHELEEKFQRYSQQSTDSSVLEKQILRFQSAVDGYLHIIVNTFGRRKVKAVTKNRNLVTLTDSIVPGLVELLQGAGQDLFGLEVRDHGMPWSEPLLDAIEKILMHALSNGVDHGFILPQQRGLKLEKPQINIEARRVGEGVELFVRDNGAGLDLPKLQILAEKVGFKPDSGRSVADVVFLDGSTTAEHISRTSGRGLGMAAIRGICQLWGGEAHLEPNPSGRGAQLTVLLRAQNAQASA